LECLDLSHDLPKVTVVVGEPIPLSDTLKRTSHLPDDERRIAIMAVIRDHLIKLGKEAEIHHAKLTWKEAES